MPHATSFRVLNRWCRILSGTAVLVAVSGVTAQTTVSTPLTAAQTYSAATNNNVTITGAGSVIVSSNNTAVTFGASGMIDNFGTISDTSTNTGGNRALNFKTGTSFVLTNEAGALVSASNEDAVHVTPTNAAISISNYGTIQSLNTLLAANPTGTGLPSGQGIDLGNILTTPNSIFNYAGAKILSTGEDAVRTGVNGTVYNNGTIKATALGGSGSDGIDAKTNSGAQITNDINGLLEGGRHGITGGNTDVTVNGGAYAMSVTNNLGGTIQGDNGSGINIDGINANEVVTVVNHGTITGNGRNIGDGLGHDGDGIDVDGVVNITNTGTIKSINSYGVGGVEFSEGVTVGGGTIVNSGTIQGSVASGNTTAIGRGITIAGVDKDASGNPIPVQAPYAATTITNSGLIKGDSDSAIIFSSALSSGLSHTITNQTGGLIQTGSTTAAAILTAADNVTITNDGTIDGSSSGNAITGGSGNLTVNYDSGSILGAINGGTGANTLNLGSGVTHTYATANFQNINVASGSSSLVGIVSGLNLTKGGSGTLILSAANTYTGTTIVSAGTLKVNNTSGSGTGSSAVQVQSGATLGGYGTISGPVTVDGIIAPGNSIGTLNVGNNVTWNGSTGNKWNFELGAGNTSDKLNVTGDFLKGSGSNFYFDFLNSATMGTYVLVDWSGGSNFTAGNFSYANLGGGLTGSFVIDGSQLEFTAIPEPATTGLFAGAGVLAFALYLRRRRAALA